MSISSPLRHYATPLFDWARDGPSPEEHIRAVLHPLGEFWPWLNDVIAPCYWRGLNRPRGLTMPQFIDECRERLFLWAKRNAAALACPEFSDDNLRRVARRLACNVRANTWREIKRGKLEHLDDYLENSGRDLQSGKLAPANLTVRPQASGAQDYPELEEDFAAARRLMPRFNRSLRAKKKMRELLALLHGLGRSEGRLEKFHAHWFVWRLLRKQKRTHLPRYIRKHLRERLPEVEYAVINARVRCLKHALASFLATL